MSKKTRTIIQVIGVLISGFIAIGCFNLLDEGESEAWYIFLLLLSTGTASGVLCVLLACKALSKSVFADAIRFGGKQMLCDIIKWTIIVIISAIVFSVTYKIIVSEHNSGTERIYRVSQRYP
jgi:hypothetical protein